MLEVIQQYQPLLSLITSAIMVVATIIYACFTVRLAREATRTRKAQTEPNVVLYLEEGVAFHFVNMVVANVGHGPAYHVEFSILQDPKVAGKEDLANVGPFSTGLEHLVHTQKLNFHFVNFVENPDELANVVVEIHVRYRNRSGYKYKETFTINFASQFGMTRVGNPAERDMAKSLDQLHKDIRRVVNGQKQIKVVTEQGASRHRREPTRQSDSPQLWKPGDP